MFDGFCRRALICVMLGGLSAVAGAQQPARPDTAHRVALPAYRYRVLGVYDQESGVPIPDVQVADVMNGNSALTTQTGTVSLLFLPDGGGLVRLRKVGYGVETFMVTISPADTTPLTVVMQRVQTLGKVVVNDTAKKFLSPALRGFEERRLSGQGGYFIPDSVLRANENEPLTDVIQSRMPGMMFETIYPGGHRFAVSTRKQCSGPVLLHACSNTPDCFVAVYVDGQLLFNTKLAHEMSASLWPSLDLTLPVNTLSGAEYYASAATAPVGMHVDDDGCGSLWLWTRER